MLPSRTQSAILYFYGTIASSNTFNTDNYTTTPTTSQCTLDAKKQTKNFDFFFIDFMMHSAY
jgi:hypothetical protein